MSEARRMDVFSFVLVLHCERFNLWFCLICLMGTNKIIISSSSAQSNTEVTNYLLENIISAKFLRLSSDEIPKNAADSDGDDRLIYTFSILSVGDM